jgi:2-oxoglutarate ferredoxin oxidoreductase subunit gamma
MQNETVIAGFGGQGVLFIGKVMAYAALFEGLKVTWFPSYGPEMRGGTANCTVVISDEEIGSPTVKHPRAIVVMNQPSLDKYEHLVAPEAI